MTVHIARKGPITAITIDRSEARNAVDRSTATALSEAFRSFEHDTAQKVAVLCGNADSCGLNLGPEAEGGSVARSDAQSNRGSKGFSCVYKVGKIDRLALGLTCGES
jgi:enoyl-CoA hydratase